MDNNRFQEHPYYNKENEERRNRRRISIAVSAQTLAHLKTRARANGHNDLGRAVDDIMHATLIRERRSRKP